ncbi:hypothetical protein NECAME_12988 [Necator americanus]|nr:hypothetical protein NECAME_12988 [Necator americanus]ETN74439.1 hypothetical protein NECAME_12988 [Necator americanus]
MGHLFQPEPPTPGYVAVTETGGEGEKDDKPNEFLNQRDAHYAGMYTHAVQMNREMDLMNRNAAASSSLDAAQLDVKLVPANPEKDKKEHEEKKKREAEEYQKQFEKPFSC